MLINPPWQFSISGKRSPTSNCNIKIGWMHDISDLRFSSFQSSGLEYLYYMTRPGNIYLIVAEATIAANKLDILIKSLENNNNEVNFYNKQSISAKSTWVLDDRKIPRRNLICFLLVSVGTHEVIVKI